MELRNYGFITIIAHCLMLSMVMASVTNNITTDQHALLALKANITHDPTNLLASNWSVSTSVCNWIGITCGIRHHRVTGLNISHMGLTGTIPSQLGSLSFLAMLDISNNLFDGSLPDELAQLRRLRDIDFAFNNFNVEIPSCLGSLPKLQYLSLRNNQFIGTIPQSLGNLSSLQELSLTYNQLSGGVPANIFSSLTNLKFLSLSANMLDGQIPSSLSNCKQLEVLSLSINNFTGRLPNEIGNLTKLRRVYLGTNKLQGPIPKSLGNCTSLGFLDLRANSFTGEVPSEIGNLPNLQFLILQSNNLVGLIPSSIFNISRLKQLAISENQLSGSLPSTIDIGLPILQALFLGANNFSGTIPDSITNASNLYALDVGSNSFSGFIPNTIGNLRSLRLLNLASNYLASSTSDLRFLSSMTNCRNLEVLQLTINPLNGVLPSSIGNLSSSLEIFSMEYCNISGSIPEEIGNLNNLTALELGNNELTGLIPSTLGRLKELQGLSLRNNELEGSIPDDLCLLESLVDLYLNDNKLSGLVPACLGNLITLRDLSLASNRLTSTIPSTLWNLKDILHFNLSSNSLNGSLPFQIGNLKVVVDLDLSRNHFSGHIPTIIGDLKDLKLLSLSYNRLQGPIPDEIGDLTSLESCDFSNNNLSAVIPKSFVKLLYLKYLNLSFNRLEGEIPMGGAFANLTVESFMGNLALCGSPQLQVPPCKTNPHRKTRTILVVLPLSIALTLLVLTFIVVSRRCHKRRTKLRSDAVISLSPEATWRRISYQELVQATNGFCESNLLGKGSFGSVYKGRLPDGLEIAVKVFHLDALKSFDIECEVLSSIRHRNLVKIISSCTNDDFKALILEYMSNGSLEKCLYSHNYFLDILQRLNIMIDVGSALEYLHFGCSTPIVHCDLKPDNVLLDGKFVAHLSDFGITKLFGEEESMKQTQTLGTIGYMAPEYGREGKISVKGDVYSYGIMLMETFTRKKPTDEIFVGEMSLKRWVGDSIDGSIIEIVDSNLLRREDTDFFEKEQCLSSVFYLAMDCTMDSLEKRIDMKNALSRLMRIRVALLANTRKA